MKWLDDQRAYLRELGPDRYWAMWASVLLIFGFWILANLWVADWANWPEAYDVQCRGRRCTAEWMWSSPKLLANGTVPALAMFAVIWVGPPLLVWVIIMVSPKPKARKRRRKG